MNEYQDSRITQLEMIMQALLAELGYEAVIDSAPILRKKEAINV